MRSIVLLTLSLVAGLFAHAQTSPVLKAHSYYDVGQGGVLTIGDSLVHFHSNGRNSTAKPTAANYYYPRNGAFADDSAVSFDVMGSGSNMAFYSRKFNAAGLPTVYTQYLSAYPGVAWKQVFYTYNAQMLPDTITTWANGNVDSRQVHEYQNGKLTGIRGYQWASVPPGPGWIFAGVDSFIAAGPGSDSIYARYMWNGTTLQKSDWNSYKRDAFNRILADSVFNNGQLSHLRRCTYNTQGRLSLDSTFWWNASTSGLDFASKTNYLYDAQANLTGVKQSNWWSVIGAFVGVNVDSFSYNQHHQVTRFMRYDSTATGRVPVTGSTAQFFYYDSTTSVHDRSTQATLKLYPVPATTYINISMSFHKPQAFSVRIFDIQGRLMSQWQEQPQQTYRKQIPLNGMAPGQYIVHLLAGEESCSRQFMVMK